MRFLGIGDYNSLGDMYWRLGRSGHQVRVYVHETEAHGIFSGMLERCDAWRAELDWIRAAGDEGIIVFESASMGAIADELRSDGFQVVGGSVWGDRLELDRAFGQQVMRDAGMQTAPVTRFSAFDDAIAFVRDQPGRYVYKLSDSSAASTRNYVSEMDSGADLIAILGMEKKRYLGMQDPEFILMQHLTGVEVGIGAYFDGEKFLTPACIDWEHKRFFPGDLGELTGEMGTVVSYRHSEKLFRRTLERIEGGLRDARHHGYVNINTIVNADGVWPLEFTCRFGYPGFAICDALHIDGWDVILKKMVGANNGSFATRDGFAVGVVLNVPPFPYEYGYAELSKSTPIFLRESMTEVQRHDLHFGEVALIDGQLTTSGSLGYVMVVTGTGERIEIAQAAAYERARQVVIPNMRYRNDIGDKLKRHDLAALRALDLLD